MKIEQKDQILDTIYMDKLKVKLPIQSVIQICLKAIRDCNIELTFKTDSYIKGRTRASLFSWGEEIYIRFIQSDNDIEIEVSSEPIAQLFDWRKSKKNVECILSAIKNHLNGL